MKKIVKRVCKKITVSGLLIAMVCNQIVPASAAMIQAASDVLGQSRMVKTEKASPSDAEEATPSNENRDKLTDEYDYNFDENMILNSDFSEGEDGWTFDGGGVAENNPNNNPGGSGGSHFYISKVDGYMNQTVRVPYTGYYHVSVWGVSTGVNNKFGVKNAKTGNVIKELTFARQLKYTRYEMEVFLEKDDLAEIYVMNQKGWVNGDDVTLSYDTSKFPDMTVNGDFEDETGWILNNAEISAGKVVLGEKDSSISQIIYIPKDGPYLAEVTVKDAEDADVSYGGEERTGINGDETIRLHVPELITPEETEIVISGKTTVNSVRVRYDLESLENTAPSVENIQVTGEMTAGKTITASYKFTDADGHMEGDSKYAWLLSDTVDGEFQPIEGETAKSITLKDQYEDKFFKFQVTPVDQFEKAGDETVSDAVGPVAVNLVKNPGFESKRANWTGVMIREDGAHTGTVRGIAQKGKMAYQDILINKSGVYRFSVYTKYTGSETGKVGITAKSGGILVESEIDSGWEYALTEEMVTLEKGQEIRVFFEGASDRDYDIDDVGLFLDKEAVIPPLNNIVDLKVSNKNMTVELFQKEKRVNVRYRYGVDVSAVKLKELVLSEGATASVEIGAVMNLTEPFEITVTGSDGAEQVWTVTSEEEEKQIYLESSNQNLEENFNWAAKKQRQFVMTGKSGVINKDENHPNGDGGNHEYIPSYWAGYYNRSGFYGRDFVHQATGGQIAGLAEENYSMFSAFAEHCTEARKWYTVWALNFDGSPLSIDYRNDDDFVREVPAQFELVEKAYEQYLWSGDDRYISDEMFEFYTRVMTDYVELHDTQLTNGVAEGTGKGIFQGSCTYNERGGEHPIEAGDALGSQYQATLAYAGILKARGNEAGAEEWYEKAADLKDYFNNSWSKNPAGELENYARAIEANGRKFYDFGKENSWFMPLKMITEPGERNDRYIDFILENLGDGIGSPGAPTNLEAYTYIPDMLFLYNRSDEAWRWMKYITSIKDDPHENAGQGTNGDYPEISFTYVSHTIEGMMGVEPDARTNFVATAPRLPEEVDDVTARYITIGETDIDLTHTGNRATDIMNHSDDELTWEPRFYGNFNYIQVGDEILPAQHKSINGEEVSYVTTMVAAGEDLSAEAVDGEIEESFELKAPENAAKDVEIPVTFTWTEEPWARSYKIIVSENESFEAEAIVMEESVDDTTAVCREELKAGTTYYWKVEAVCGTTEDALVKTSKIWNFQTKHEDENQESFELMAPMNTAKDIEIPVTFAWTEEPGAVSYKLTVSEDDSFDAAAIVLEKTVNDTKTVCGEELKPGTDYYWKVEAVCGMEEKPVVKTSEIWSFNTKRESVPDPVPDPIPDPKPERDKSGDSESSTVIEGAWKLDALGWWYRFNDGTYPKNGWAYLNYEGKYNWYYFDENGYMLDGFIMSGGQQYYLSTTSDGTRGQMYMGWHQIDGKWYYFNTGSGAPVGAMLTNTTTPDGWAVGNDGVWIK